MKRISFFLSLAVIITCVSCGGLKTDVKKKLKLFKEYTEIANKASEDGKLDDDEIKDINEIQSKIDDFIDKMDKKYENNEEAEKEMFTIIENLNGEIVLKEYMEAMDKLYDCEGWNHLE
ncbi:MAG TPA: hypothetical protein PLO05_01210 [Bacteroidales bacterium]|nr:hypothetical protein [Bacteroidales bacterium]